MEAVTVGVIIGTYGDLAEWAPMVKRASASVSAQTRQADIVQWEHADTLQHARNWGAGSTATEWFIFLDADDEIDAGYIEAMLEVAETGAFDIIQPCTLGVYPDGSEDSEAVLIPETDLNTSNFLVIGSMVRSDLFLNVGGFDDYACLEDWALWLKLRNCGARIGKAPEAVYRVHVSKTGRNQDTPEMRLVYSQIRSRFAK